MHSDDMINRHTPEVLASDSQSNAGHDADSGPMLRALLVLIPTPTLLGACIAAFLDAPTSCRSPHVLYELTLLVISLATGVCLWHGWKSSAAILQIPFRRRPHVLTNVEIGRSSPLEWDIDA